MVRKPIVPKKVSFSEKLREARPSKKIVVALMVATAVLTMLIGFNYGGWVTGGISQQMVTTGADYVKKQGWATMPGEKTPDNDVASVCTKLLMGS